MKTAENTIDIVKLEKYTFTIYKRENPTKYVNKPFAVIYEKATPKGKYSKTKIIEHYVYESLEKCEEYITNLYSIIHKRIKANKKNLIEKRQAQKNLKATDFYIKGDIIYSSWGYEQTNVDFYQVIKMTAKTITVKKISQEIEEGSVYSHGMAHNVLAVKDSFLDNVKEFRLSVRPEGRLAGGSSYEYFSKWGGESKYVSFYY